MSTSHIPHLRVVPSAGRPEPVIVADEDGGHPIHVEVPSIPCGGCQKLTDAGELITKYRNSWWHQDCARRDVEAGNATSAWLALGHDLARSPRSYNVRETRAIVGALLGMVHVPETAPISDEEPEGGRSA